MSWENIIKEANIWQEDLRNINWALAMLEVFRDYGVRTVIDEEKKIQTYNKLEREQQGHVESIIKILEELMEKIEKEALK